MVKQSVSVLFLVVALLAVAGNARAEDACNPSKFGLEKCPGDIAHFVNNLSACRQPTEHAKNPACETLACEYADLIRKYHGQELNLRLLQGSLEDMSGEDAATYGSKCRS